MHRRLKATGLKGKLHMGEIALQACSDSVHATLCEAP
jgi:hypothetical protein